MLLRRVDRKGSLFQSLTHALSGGGKLVAVSVPPIRLRCQDGRYRSWDQTIDVNLKGECFCPKYEIRQIVWMCSDKASFRTGQSIVLDGGFLAGKILRASALPLALQLLLFDGDCSPRFLWQNRPEPAGKFLQGSVRPKRHTAGRDRNCRVALNHRHRRN
jgi:hypothetical protein